MTIRFPAFCPHCGLIFESRFGIKGTVARVVMEGNREQCPNCGHMAELPDGTFNVADDTIEVLAASDLTRERLQHLKAILDQVHTGHVSTDDAASAVAEEMPELKPLIDRYGPVMGRALLAFLWFVFSLLAQQIVAEMRDDSATKEDVRQAVEQVIDECREQEP